MGAIVRISCRSWWLMTWKDNVLKKNYREETLSSALARSTFLLPDKAVAEAS